MEKIRDIPEQYKSEQYLCKICKNLITLKSLIKTQSKNYITFSAL